MDDRAGERAHPCEHGSETVGPLAIDWRASHANGTTLVTVRVENTRADPRRVRIDNLLDGRIAPPRSHGVPERGWDDDGVERRLAGGETLSVGYACDAPMTTPPVAVRGAAGGDEAEVSPVEEALRSLGDHAPPRAVLPDDEPESLDRSTDDPATGRDDDGDESSFGPDDSEDDTGDRVDDVDPVAPTELTPSVGDRTAPRQDEDRESAVGVPQTVAAWFDAVEARLATADRLGGDVREATPVVATLGGRAGVETLATTLDADATTLRTVAARATALADRVDATDVPDVDVEGRG